MQRPITRGAAANAGLIFHVFAQDSTSTTGAGKASVGFASWTCYYIRNGEAISGAITPQDITTIGTYAAPTANTNIRIKAVDNTNMVGVYELQLHLDWVNVTNTCQSLTIYLSASGAAVLPLQIPLTGLDSQLLQATPTNITAGTIATVSGNVNGSVGSVTGAVGSVTGAVGSVTGAVGSVTGNVGGNVSGSVGSVVGLTASNLDATVSSRMATYTQPTGFLAATFPGTVASTTNITAGTITTTTNLTNLPAITANWLTAAGIAAGALDGKGNWNIGKTGYSLTATTGLGNQTADITGTWTGNVVGTLSTVTTLTNLPAITANWLTAAGIAATALNGKGDWNIGKTGYSLTATTGLGNQTADITGTVSTVTTLTNLPAITSNWLTAAGIAAGALNGKGDWLLSSGYTAPLSGAATATAVWTDTTAGDFTTALSIGKSVMNGVTLGTGLTVAAVSGATGSVTAAVTLPTIPTNWITADGIATDAFGALELAAGAGSEIATAVRTELATELARIDVASSTRMATYTQPTGFLAATFPGTVASPTNITAATGIVLSGVTHTGAVIPTVSAVTGLTAANLDVAVSTLATAANLALVKAKTDSLTFTTAGIVDANVQQINDVTITGNGQVGTEFGV